MKKITPHLSLLDSIWICNVWLLEHDGRRFVIDTSFGTDRWLLRRALRASNVRDKGDLSAVILTHRHSDHAHNAAWLRREYDCPVICHKDDAPFLIGTHKPAALARGVAPPHEEILCLIEDRWPARCPIDEVFETGVWKWGFRIIPTPGHTEGSVMLYHEPTRSLFSGDSILAGIPPFRSFEYLQLASKGFSPDVETCHDAVRTFLKENVPVETLCSGHGPPVVREVSRKLKKFL